MATQGRLRLLVGVALVVIFQLIIFCLIQKAILELPVDSSVLAHVDDVILIIFIVVSVPVLNHLVLIKIAAPVGGV